MTCEEAKVLFDEKLDGLLDETKTARLDAHLSECETCRREYERLEKTHACLAAFAVDLPSDLSEGVMARIGCEKKRRTISKKWLSPLVAIPAVALLCFALLNSPLFDAMMPAKEVADMSAVADHKNDFHSNLNSGLSFKEEAEGAPGIAPEEISPVANAVVGTPLTIFFIDEKNAVLTHKADGTNENVTYSQQENIITIEKNGQKISFILANNTLTPTDTSLLDALLSK